MREIEKWITMGGKHIPIFKDDNVSNNLIKRQTSNIIKIPKGGNIKNINRKLNTVYMIDNKDSEIYDIEVRCKSMRTAINKLVKMIPKLKGLEESYPEPNNNLSKEYDSFTAEQYDDIWYISARHFK